MSAAVTQLVLQERARIGSGPAPPPHSVRRRRVWRHSPAAVAAAAVAAMAVPRLDERPVWLDEAFTVGATHDLTAAWRGTGGTMALYYLLMWPVAQVSTDRVWLRLPSLLFAVAAVLVVYAVGQVIGGRRTATFAAGTLAVSWALSRWAIEARSYTLALLLVSLSWLGLVGAVRDREDTGRRRRWWRLFVIAALLAPLAHGLAALHVVGQVGALALAPDRRRWLRWCIPLGVALAAEGLLLFAVGAGEVATWIDPLHWDQVARIGFMLFGRSPSTWVLGPLTFAAAVGVASRFGRERTEDAWRQLVPVFWAFGTPLVIVAISVARPYAESRYVIGAVPGVALLVGGLLARIRSTRVAVALCVLVVASVVPLQTRVTTSAREEWPAVADHIAARAADGDRLMTPAMLRAPFDYAWTERGAGPRPDLEPLSPVDLIGEVQRFYDPAPGGLRSRLLADTSRTVWYVDRDDERYDEVAALVTDPEVTEHYVVTGPLLFARDLYLVEFRPRTTTP